MIEHEPDINGNYSHSCKKVSCWYCYYLSPPVDKAKITARKIRSNAWSEKQVDILIDKYSNTGTKELMSELKKSKKAIWSKAADMKLHRGIRKL